MNPSIAHKHVRTHTRTHTQRPHTSQASTVTGGAPAAVLRAAAEFITEVQEQTGGLERRSPRVITGTDMRTDRQKALLITAEGKMPRESGQRKDRKGEVFHCGLTSRRLGCRKPPVRMKRRCVLMQIQSRSKEKAHIHMCTHAHTPQTVD